MTFLHYNHGTVGRMKCISSLESVEASTDSKLESEDASTDPKTRVGGGLHRPKRQSRWMHPTTLFFDRQQTGLVGTRPVYFQKKFKQFSKLIPTSLGTYFQLVWPPPTGVVGARPVWPQPQLVFAPPSTCLKKWWALPQHA